MSEPTPADAGTTEEAPSLETVEAVVRRQLATALGGRRGMIEAAVPTRYTVSLASASSYYTVDVRADPSTGLGSYHYGDVPCQFASPTVRVSGHVQGIDVRLVLGHWLSTGARESTGTAIVGAQVYPMYYVAAWDFWCSVESNGGYSIIEADGAQRVFYPSGTYKVQFDPSQNGLQQVHPYTWYPSAPTVHSARTIVLDRDLTGGSTLWVDVPKAYAISGRLIPQPANGEHWIQVVMSDGGKIGVVAEGYPLDWSTYSYSLMVPAGAYKVRHTTDAVSRRTTYRYYPDAATTFETAGSVTVTNADVSGIDIRR